jgi:hypothetical protein
MSFLKQIIFAVMTVAILASCDHNVSMITDVQADGSLEKTIVLEKHDPHNNMFGISPARGWDMDIKRLASPPDTAKDDHAVMRKKFPSAAAANAELAVPNDTLFRVTSTFEKKFRWFYTYIYYADTYHALNRMRLPISDYLTQEDYAFIDRLPAEGKPMARADSLYLTELNRKLFEIYGAQAIFEMHYTTAEALLRKTNVAPAWLDTLRHHKKDLFNQVRGEKEIDEDFMEEAMDSLGIPLPIDAFDQFTAMMKPNERIMTFISTANDGKYQHAIRMPWNVVHTNADSVSGRELFWSPPSMKFLVKDYTMYAEARQMNGLPIALSVMAIGFTVYLLLRRRGAQAL